MFIREMRNIHGQLIAQWDDATRAVYDAEWTFIRDYNESEIKMLEDEIISESMADAARARDLVKEAVVDAMLYTSEATHVDGEEWIRPTGAHDAYPKGAKVTHAAKSWESLTPANVWEPGVSAWREEAGSEPIQWIQPTGAHDAYAKGAIALHNDFIWVSDVDDNVWEPGVYGWTKQ